MAEKTSNTIPTLATATSRTPLLNPNTKLKTGLTAGNGLGQLVMRFKPTVQPLNQRWLESRISGIGLPRLSPTVITRYAALRSGYSPLDMILRLRQRQQAAVETDDFDFFRSRATLAPQISRTPAFDSSTFEPELYAPFAEPETYPEDLATFPMVPAEELDYISPQPIYPLESTRPTLNLPQPRRSDNNFTVTQPLLSNSEFIAANTAQTLQRLAQTPDFVPESLPIEALSFYSQPAPPEMNLAVPPLVGQKAQSVAPSMPTEYSQTPITNLPVQRLSDTAIQAINNLESPAVPRTVSYEPPALRENLGLHKLAEPAIAPIIERAQTVNLATPVPPHVQRTPVEPVYLRPSQEPTEPAETQPDDDFTALPMSHPTASLNQSESESPEKKDVPGISSPAVLPLPYPIEPPQNFEKNLVEEATLPVSPKIAARPEQLVAPFIPVQTEAVFESHVARQTELPQPPITPVDISSQPDLAQTETPRLNQLISQVQAIEGINEQGVGESSTTFETVPMPHPLQRMPQTGQGREANPTTPSISEGEQIASALAPVKTNITAVSNEGMARSYSSLENQATSNVVPTNQAETVMPEQTTTPEQPVSRSDVFTNPDEQTPVSQTGNNLAGSEVEQWRGSLKNESAQINFRNEPASPLFAGETAEVPRLSQLVNQAQILQREQEGAETREVKSEQTESYSALEMSHPVQRSETTPPESNLGTPQNNVATFAPQAPSFSGSLSAENVSSLAITPNSEAVSFSGTNKGSEVKNLVESDQINPSATGSSPSSLMRTENVPEVSSTAESISSITTGQAVPTATNSFSSTIESNVTPIPQTLQSASYLATLLPLTEAENFGELENYANFASPNGTIADGIIARYFGGEPSPLTPLERSYLVERGFLPDTNGQPAIQSERAFLGRGNVPTSFDRPVERSVAANYPITTDLPLNHAGEDRQELGGDSGSSAPDNVSANFAAVAPTFTNLNAVQRTGNLSQPASPRSLSAESETAYAVETPRLTQLINQAQSLVAAEASDESDYFGNGFAPTSSFENAVMPHPLARTREADLTGEIQTGDEINPLFSTPNQSMPVESQFSSGIIMPNQSVPVERRISDEGITPLINPYQAGSGQGEILRQPATNFDTDTVVKSPVSSSYAYDNSLSATSGQMGGRNTTVNNYYQPMQSGTVSRSVAENVIARFKGATSAPSVTNQDFSTRFDEVETLSEYSPLATVHPVIETAIDSETEYAVAPEIATAPEVAQSHPVRRSQVSPAPVTPQTTTPRLNQLIGQATQISETEESEKPVAITPSGIVMPDVILRSSVGKPLDNAVQTRMANILGRKFEDVQVHDTPQAADYATQLGAEAFTIGSNIFFAANRYQPETPSGQALIGHELTHIMQNANLPSLSDGRLLDNSHENLEREREASLNERIIMQHVNNHPTAASTPSSNGSSYSPPPVQRTYQPSSIVHLASQVQRQPLNNPTQVQRVEGEGSAGTEEKKSTQELDMDAIADAVYTRLKRKLIIERERFGKRSSTLPY